MFDQLGFEHLLWQMRTVDDLYTWDAMPRGFLAHYYGTQIDQPCAVAEAIRQHWHVFTFAQAREHFANRPNAREAEKVWRSFGVNDGVVLSSGWGAGRSTVVLGCLMEAEPGLIQHGAVLAAAAWRLHRLLEGHPKLVAISRTLVDLSPKQLDVLQMHIDNPELTLAQQAEMLGVSVRTVERRHKQIAKRFGVSNFASAVTIAVKRQGR